MLKPIGAAADGGVRQGLDSPVLTSLDPALRAHIAELSSRLWADAAKVDAAESLPAAHLEAFSRTGLYGVLAPTDEGGLSLSYGQLCAVVEELASACLATTFLWVQHFAFLGAMLDEATPALLRDRWREGAISGAVKGGVVLTGLMPGPARLTAGPAEDGWAIRGEAPWVSGWGTIDLAVVVARAPEDTTVSLLVDAKAQPGLTVAPARLSALNATRTVSLGFDEVTVGHDRFLGRAPYDGQGHSQRLRLNGSFALGVAKRCCLLLGPSPLDEDLRACREGLDAASEATMAAARAAACELAVRAAHVVAVDRGSRSALAGDHAERLSREAALLLVFGSRPAIKEALLRRLQGAG